MALHHSDTIYQSQPFIYWHAHLSKQNRALKKKKINLKTYIAIFTILEHDHIQVRASSSFVLWIKR